MYMCTCIHSLYTVTYMYILTHQQNRSQTEGCFVNSCKPLKPLKMPHCLEFCKCFLANFHIFAIKRTSSILQCVTCTVNVCYSTVCYIYMYSQCTCTCMVHVQSMYACSSSCAHASWLTTNLGSNFSSPCEDSSGSLPAMSSMCPTKSRVAE